MGVYARSKAMPSMLNTSAYFFILYSMHVHSVHVYVYTHTHTHMHLCRLVECMHASTFMTHIVGLFCYTVGLFCYTVGHVCMPVLKYIHEIHSTWVAASLLITVVTALAIVGKTFLAVRNARLMIFLAKAHTSSVSTVSELSLSWTHQHTHMLCTHVHLCIQSCPCP